jgi:hypothetical protein
VKKKHIHFDCPTELQMDNSPGCHGNCDNISAARARFPARGIDSLQVTQVVLLASGYLTVTVIGRCPSPSLEF